ncbi:carboxypeptidase regulatory-like domain-containing protein [Parasphingopyxis algicola]|uniref:MSCRAMM family protein n=1 Tax=Parasphingopyxis algicola TaxID=2026624 RepID=UPI0015A3B0F1|nr:carboxypeptidase-like regulatory domain-containing protein [Parasphingopyxis algicola]QLC25618.1 carboxypeptidase regulatory-like domain-containing protein [Parasphingopyxis algicola]
MLRWGHRAKHIQTSLVALCTAASASAQVAWDAHPDDSLLLEVRLGEYRLGDAVRGYQTPQGVCIDLADTIAALDLPIAIDEAANRAEGWAFAEENEIVIDRNRNRVRFGESAEDLPNGTIFDTPEGWCVTTQTLAAWLGVTMEADLRNAVLLLRSDQPLPVERGLERRARAASLRPRVDFDLSALPQADTPYRMWRTPSVDIVVSLGGLRDRQRRSSGFERRYEIYAVGEILTASVDARLASDDRGVPQSLRMRAFRSSNEANLLGPLGATHFAIGDVSSQSSPIAAQPTPGRGGIVTNRPLDQPDSFDRRTFRGELPEGWEAELYRNGQLLAFSRDRGDGRYEFVDVELRYGINRFEVVLYGPQGQIRRETEIINVGAASIPPRQTWYWAGASQDDRDLVSLDNRDLARDANWRAGLGLERGLNPRTSLAFQLNNMVIADDRMTVVEGSVRRAIGPALVEVTAAWADNGGYAARAQLLGRFGRAYINAESVVARDFRTERYGIDTTGRHSLAVDHSVNLGRVVMPVRVQATYQTREDGADQLDGAARISANMRRFALTGEIGYRRQGAGTADGLDPPDQTNAAILANGRIGRVRLRGEARWRLSPGSRFESASLTADWGGGENSAWRSELGYQATLDRARASIGYVRRFNRFALTASAETATDGSVAAGLNLAFSIGPDPRGGVHMTADKLASSGQTVARVYRDLNNDGVRQPNEPFEEGVQITTGRAPANDPTDENGLAVVTGLTPYRPILVGIDTSSLADPFVQPRGPGVVVTPRPGTAAAVELPLVSAGEIDGMLVRAGGGALEGVDLELVDIEGRVVQVVRTDFDGFFVFQSVPYGQYSVRMAELSAQALGAIAALGRRAFVTDENDSVRLGTVAIGGNAVSSSETP